MPCISTECQKFNDCRRAALSDDGVAVRWASFASGGGDASGNSWIKHACGPLGGYAMFEPRHEDGDINV